MAVDLMTTRIHLHFLDQEPTVSLFAPDYRSRQRTPDHVDKHQPLLYKDFLRNSELAATM